MIARFIGYIIGVIISFIFGVLFGVKLDFVVTKDREKNIKRCVNCKHCMRIIDLKTNNQRVECKMIPRGVIPDYCGHFLRKSTDIDGDIYPEVHDTLHDYITAIDNFCETGNKNK